MDSGPGQRSRRGRDPGRPRLRRALSRAAWPALALAALALVALTVVGRLGTSSRSNLVVASMPYWNIGQDTTVVLAHRKDINEVSPWIYGLSKDGVIVPQYASGKAAAAAADIARLQAAGMRVVPSIANITAGNWSYQPIARILHNADLRRQQVAAIVALVEHYRYAGIDIDFEELHPSDQAAFTDFITELGTALHQHGKILSVAVFPKTSATGGSQANAAQNYAAIGKVADQVRIMGYNYHWANSPPGAVAPIGWVRSVLSYATTQMPASKVVLGIPLFGYDWPDGNGPGQAISWLQALRLSRQYNVTARYDKSSQAPWFSYAGDGRSHIVWFENSASSLAKFQAVKGSGVAGVYLWMFGYEDPGTWSALHAQLPITSPSASASATAAP
jgi:spore germination protein